MDKKYYNDFVEILSLQNKIGEHQERIKSHELRKTHLIGQQDFRLKKLEGNSKEIVTREENFRKKECLLIEAEKRIKNELLSFEEQNQIDREKEALENEILEELEDLDHLKKEIEEAKRFLEGSKKTYDRFVAQVKKDVGEENRHIKNYEERINILMEDFPDSLKMRVTKLFERFKFKKPLSYAINRQCKECHMTIAQGILENVDRGHTLQECPSCGRILIPAP